MTKLARTRIEVKPRLIVKDERALGPGKADLLDAIARTGSISAAARDLDMSYRRAWQLVDVMNKSFKKPLVEAAPGGKAGGGAAVTEYGREALALYRNLQAALEQSAAKFAAPLEKLLK